MRVAAGKNCCCWPPSLSCRWLLKVAGSSKTLKGCGGCSSWQPLLQVGPEATVEIQITDNQQMAEFDFHM